MVALLARLVEKEEGGLHTLTEEGKGLYQEIEEEEGGEDEDSWPVLCDAGLGQLVRHVVSAHRDVVDKVGMGLIRLLSVASATSISTFTCSTCSTRPPGCL